MSNTQIIIEERAVNIGNFMVGRLLPFRQKRMVGPFIYIDHMGPAHLGKDENFDVLPHPHIGLSTLTFLFEGSIFHRDTLGNKVEIKPGEVNWMTAGKGIVHSERTPEYLRSKEKNMHGLQIWVALPKTLEQMQPEFFHVDKSQIPIWTEGDLTYTLVAGEALGRKSPVPVYSPLFMIEIKSKSRQTVHIGKELFGECGLYILEGSIHNEGNTYLPKQILVAMDSRLCSFDIEENSTIYLFGGEAFPEERFIDWNFVSSDKALIDEAKRNWLNQTFDKIEGETDFVPLPEKSRPHNL